MGRHDFSRTTVEQISSQIEALKNLVEESTISLENMPFSWKNLSIDGTIQWFETEMIKNDKKKMSIVLQNALMAYSQKVNDVEQVDNLMSDALTDNIFHLYAVGQKLQTLVQSIQQDPSVPGSYTGLRTTLLNFDKSNGTLAFERMTEDERDQYYQECLNMDPEDVTEADRRMMRKYCERYLKPKFEIDEKMSDTEKKYRDKYIALYEKAYPEEAAKFKTFFDNSAKDGITSEDVANIKAIAYMSKEPHHTIFFEYIDQCKVETWKNDGSLGKTKNSHYDSETASVYLNLDQGRDGVKDPSGPYNTVFHELGHNIDNLMGKEKSGGIYRRYYSGAYVDNGNFYDVIYDDVYENFEESVYEYIQENDYSISEEGQQAIIEVLMGRKDPSTLDSHPKWKKVYKYVLREYTGSWRVGKMYIFSNKDGILTGVENAMICDITNGITNNANIVMDGNGYIDLSFEDMYGHSYDYWYMKITENGKIIMLPAGDVITSEYDEVGAQEEEFFAEYFAYAMTGDKDEENAREYFKNSYKVMDNAMEEKAAEIRARNN